MKQIFKNKKDYKNNNKHERPIDGRYRRQEFSQKPNFSKVQRAIPLKKTDSATTFTETMMKKMGYSASERSKIELLADMAYEKEIQLKNESLQLWWKCHEINCTLEPLVPAPIPRGYRSTTKRRAVIRGTKLYFTHADNMVRNSDVADSLLDPPTHKGIYTLIYDIVSDKRNRLFAMALNFVILRQAGNEMICIFNVSEMNAEIVRSAKAIGEKLKTVAPMVQSAFLFFDPTRSDYYLEQDFDQKGAVRIKKLYGYDTMRLTHNEIRTMISPFGFMQVNMPVANLICETILDYFQPNEKHRLLDLFCGYGLFSFHVGQKAGEIIGVDAEGHSIECAKKCGEFYPNGKYRFYARSITEGMFENLLPRSLGNELIILDPPRSGVSEGVIEEIVLRNPEKVAHIFCNTEVIAQSVAAWQKYGYAPVKCIPYDMFAGTPNCEIVIFLEKKV